MSTEQYLHEQVAELNRRAHQTRIMGYVASVLLLGYGIFGIWFVGKLTDPEQLSQYALYSFGEKAPKVITAMELKLSEQAPAVAEDLSRAIQKAIPDTRANAERAISQMLAHQLGRLEREALALTDAYFEAHQHIYTPRGPNESISTYAHRIGNSLASDFGENLDNHLKETTGLALTDINARTESLLSMLDTHIEELASGQSLDQSDKMERLLIAHLIQKYLGQLPE
jgi:hypothetical protein